MKSGSVQEAEEPVQVIRVCDNCGAENQRTTPLDQDPHTGAQVSGRRSVNIPTSREVKGAFQPKTLGFAPTDVPISATLLHG